MNPIQKQFALNRTLSNGQIPIRRRSVLALIVAVVAACLLGSPASADKPPKKKNNCLIVTITNWTLPTRVFLECFNPTPAPGTWVKVDNKLIQKNDHSQTEFCGLTPGTTYRIKATTQGAESDWLQFVFQPDPNTGTTNKSLTLTPVQ